MTSGASYSKSNGSQITLGNQVGNRGGEGTVYAVNGEVNLLAKIYHTGKEKEREAKISAMIEARLFEKLGFGAFPREQLFSGSNNVLGLSKSSFTGFTMERIENAYPVHQLWNAKDRAKHYPQADFRFLVRAASNLAQNFARLHAEGIVIGDVNESGIWVSNRAYVRLIDCDSFQATLNGKNFPCLVLVEEYTPPELMGKKLARKNRTPNHDNFALAVMIFRLLMAGQHPFNARYTGLGESPTRGRLIAEFKYPYSRTALGHTFEAPPHAPEVSVFSDEMQAAFEEAFGKNGVHNRPTADRWAELIQRYDDALLMCSRNPAHFHHPNAKGCPLCRVEKKRGEKLFASLRTQKPFGEGGRQPTPTTHRRSRKPVALVIALVIGGLILGLNYFQSLEDDRQRAWAQAARDRQAARVATQEAESARLEKIAAAQIAEEAERRAQEQEQLAAQARAALQNRQSSTQNNFPALAARNTGYLGVELRATLRDDPRLVGASYSRGASVEKVVSGLPAERYGVQTGDVIVTINDHRTLDHYQVIAEISSYQPSTTLSLGIIRNHNYVKIDVILGSRLKITGNNNLNFLGATTRRLKYSDRISNNIPPNETGFVIIDLGDTTGFMLGDVITSFNNEPITNPLYASFTSQRLREAGHMTAPMVVYRGGQRLNLNLNVATSGYKFDN